MIGEEVRRKLGGKMMDACVKLKRLRGNVSGNFIPFKRYCNNNCGEVGCKYAGGRHGG